MPNAKDVKLNPQTLILNLGDTGSGKSTLLGTYPGKVFAYIFDPNALRSYRGMDIEYEEFLPDILTMDIKSLMSDEKIKKSGGNPTEAKIAKKLKSNKFGIWEKDFYDKLDSGFLQEFDCIGFDSGTMFLELIMDNVLTINGRPGQFPQQDDWPTQMVTFSNVMRTLTGLGKDIYVTGHCELKEDITKALIYQPLMTGTLKKKVPLLFSEIWHADAMMDNQTKEVKFRIQTRPDRRNPTIRSSIRNLAAFEDVTIDWEKPLQEQGLARILAHDHDSSLKVQPKAAVIKTGR